MAKVTFHGEHGGAAENDGSLRSFARELEFYAKFFDGLVLFLEFLGLLFGLFVFLGVVFFLRVGGSGIFLVAFRFCIGLWLVLLLAFFLFFFGRLEGNGGERLAEEAGADGPSDGLAIVGPRKVISADIGGFLHGNGARVNHDGGSFAADYGHGEHVELIHDVSEGPVAIGADAHIVGGAGLIGKAERRRFHLQVRAAVGAVVAQ